MNFLSRRVKGNFWGVIATLLIFGYVIPVAGISHAKGLPEPSSETLITIDGKIGFTNDKGEAKFDREMLKALGTRSITTPNPFETGIHTFEGVLIRDLLKAVQAKGTRLVAVAHDGYTVEVPIEDTAKYPVMLAMIWNGKEMKIRNRGPLWIIYPIGQYPELIHQKYSARSVWQLKRLTVE